MLNNALILGGVSSVSRETPSCRFFLLFPCFFLLTIYYIHMENTNQPRFTFTCSVQLSEMLDKFCAEWGRQHNTGPLPKSKAIPMILTEYLEPPPAGSDKPFTER